eukprot:m.1063043 g.1063043  ORF g.1063043 m.1063043 type:complete len:312 (+) comp24215_c0_seq62:76-1011(+)
MQVHRRVLKTCAPGVQRYLCGASTEQPNVVSSNKCFGGSVTRYTHQSESVKGKMNFAVYTPEIASNRPVPTLYWLSGLTCTDENFITKAGAFRRLAHHGIQIVCPDTSPRGNGIDGEDESYDFGTGAGFYISSTTPKYSANYQMFDYVTDELPWYIEQHFPAIPGLKSVFGHSMGGLGALNCFLKTPSNTYQSVSAFSPICNPTNCAWGQKAFSGYLGGKDTDATPETWKEWDPAEQLHKLHATRGNVPDVLISQGTDDQFLHDGQLRPESLPQCDAIDLRMEDGYDHSYFFIASFIDDHIDYHAQHLLKV